MTKGPQPGMVRPKGVKMPIEAALGIGAGVFLGALLKQLWAGWRDYHLTKRDRDTGA
jgi:hypothetical protein